MRQKIILTVSLLVLAIIVVMLGNSISKYNNIEYRVNQKEIENKEEQQKAAEVERELAGVKFEYYKKKMVVDYKKEDREAYAEDRKEVIRLQDKLLIAEDQKVRYVTPYDLFYVYLVEEGTYTQNAQTIPNVKKVTLGIAKAIPKCNKVISRIIINLVFLNQTRIGKDPSTKIVP